METNYLDSIRKQFEYYKMLGDKTLEQVPEEKLFSRYNEDSNSIATIVRHLSGNMLSRWTDFLTTDGEKQWRNRDAEFEAGVTDKNAIIRQWNEGWDCFFAAINSLQPEDLSRTVYIRNMGHSVLEAINRQLAHYPYHIGQMVYIGKMICGPEWISLSIPKGHSGSYNAERFAQPKRMEHFTDELLDKEKNEIKKGE